MKTYENNLVAIIDDDADVRDSLRFFFETAGHNVGTYSSAGNYLADERAQLARCLLVDQHMPQLTGLELIATLRRRGTLPRALLMTGSLTPDMLVRAAALGVERVVEKPFVEEDLLGFIEAA